MRKQPLTSGFASTWAWQTIFSSGSLTIIGYWCDRLADEISFGFCNSFTKLHPGMGGHSNKYPSCAKPRPLYARQRIDFCHPFDPHCGSFLFLKLFVWQMFRRLWCTGKISSSNFVLLWVAGGKYFNCGYILHSSYRAVCVCKPCHFRSCCGLTSPLLFSFLQAAGYRHYF